MMNGVFLLLGSNLGNRQENLEIALQHILAKGMAIKNKSALYQTAAWGETRQPEFFNQAIAIQCPLPPEDLLSILKNIEKEMGRKSVERWRERLIDIDILYFNQQIVDKEMLKIPHPQIPFRRFTLVPLVEIAPQLIHPMLKISQSELLLQCTDPLEVTKVSEV